MHPTDAGEGTPAGYQCAPKVQDSAHRVRLLPASHRHDAPTVGKCDASRATAANAGWIFTSALSLFEVAPHSNTCLCASFLHLYGVFQINALSFLAYHLIQLMVIFLFTLVVVSPSSKIILG